MSIIVIRSSFVHSLRNLLLTRDVNVIAPAKVTKIEEEGVVTKIASNTVVIAAGYKSNKALANVLEDKVKDLSVIGDATEPRKIMTTIHEWYHAIRLMN